MMFIHSFRLVDLVDTLDNLSRIDVVTINTGRLATQLVLDSSIRARDFPLPRVMSICACVAKSPSTRMPSFVGLMPISSYDKNVMASSG